MIAGVLSDFHNIRSGRSCIHSRAAGRWEVGMATRLRNARICRRNQADVYWRSNTSSSCRSRLLTLRSFRFRIGVQIVTAVRHNAGLPHNLVRFAR